ncbi:MAG: hypothetical protein ACTSUE_07710 [Promethearchaeota archaeon]
MQGKDICYFILQTLALVVLGIGFPLSAAFNVLVTRNEFNTDCYGSLVCSKAQEGTSSWEDLRENAELALQNSLFVALGLFLSFIVLYKQKFNDVTVGQQENDPDNKFKRRAREIVADGVNVGCILSSWYLIVLVLWSEITRTLSAYCGDSSTLLALATTQPCTTDYDQHARLCYRCNDPEWIIDPEKDKYWHNDLMGALGGLWIGLAVVWFLILVGILVSVAASGFWLPDEGKQRLKYP